MTQVGVGHGICIDVENGKASIRNKMWPSQRLPPLDRGALLDLQEAIASILEREMKEPTP